VRALVWAMMVRLHRIAQENPSDTPPQRREVIERVAPALEHLAAHYDPADLRRSSGQAVPHQRHQPAPLAARRDGRLAGRVI